jgi:hypothetical protein
LIGAARRAIVVPLEGKAKQPRGSVGAFFAHPASLLVIAGVITALLSGLLVPYVTRSWQNHDRELERRSAVLHEELGVKSHLVNLVGGATSNFLGASQLRPYAEPARGTGLSDYDRAYVRWSVASAQIASQLAAYFPNSSAKQKWTDFSQNMRNTYLLIRDHRGDERGHWLMRVSEYLHVDLGRVNGILHKPLDGTSRNQTYEAALRMLLLEIQKKESLVVSVIVDEPSALRTSEAGLDANDDS